MDDWTDYSAWHEEIGGPRGDEPGKVVGCSLLLVAVPVSLAIAIIFLNSAFTQPYFGRGWDVFAGAFFAFLGAVSIVKGVRVLRAAGRKKSRKHIKRR